ncbi:hypothetical protein C8F01DRAFT_1155153 [Mycena amicta]|nr:hypothetical protein C8F01DRAFT_1155153 [Mycena amicta]
MRRFLRKDESAWDDSPEPLGCIAFIPPTSFRLLNAFRVPPYFWRPDGLVVRTRGPPNWRTTIFIDRPFHRALRILQLPEHIRKLALENACVSWFHGKRSIPDDIEVGINRATHLHAILDRSEVGEVEAMDESARVVFIHVWDLQNIHRMPLLAERRRRRSSETRFCLYGMHHRIHPQWYQAREIYPRGGIVTFTPAALLYDLPGVLKIICNIAASEYWTDDIDPIAEDWQELFDLIVEGDVAFMRTPPPNSSLSMSRKQSSADWIRTHIDLRPLTASSGPGILGCSDESPTFNTGGSTLSVDSFLKLARAELHEDICRAQATFAFATDYRRVVAQWDGVGGIEWMVLRDALDLSWDAE